MNTLLKETEVDNDYRNYNFINLHPEITTEKGTIYKSSGRHFINRSEYMELCGLLSNETSTIAERPNFSYIPVYFDIDLKSKEKKKLYTEEQVKQIIERINQVLPRFYDITQENFKCALLEKQIYKSGEYYKNGFHLHYPCIFVNRDFFIKKVFPIITEEVKKHVHMDLDYIYSNGWLMYNCSKKPNLKPYLVTKFYDYNCKVMTVLDALKDYHIYDSNEDLISITEENHMTKLSNVFSLNLWNRNEYITEVKNNELLEFLQVQQQKKIEKEERKKKYADNRDFSEKAEDIKKYLPLITQNSEYRIWYDVAQAIYNELDGTEEGLDLFIEWSKFADNFDEYACERLYNSLKSTNSTIGTIKHLAKEYSPQEYAQLNSKQKIVFVEKEEAIVFNDSIDIKKDDNYYWVDFERKYTNTIFRDYEDLKQNIIQDLPRVLVKITLGKGFYIKKEHNDALCDLIPIKDMKRIVFKYGSVFRNKKGQDVTETLTIKLDDIYTDCRLPLYSHPDMILDKTIKSNAYNIFKGIKASKVENINMDLIQKFFMHIETIICNDNKEASHFFISWMRWLMIHPDIKTKIFVFLFSKEGYGKSTIGNFLSQYIFGDTASHISAGLDSLTSGFNKHLLGKLFCQVEELPSTSENFHKQFDNMKTLITENKMFCNPKGIDGFKMNNFLNFLGCSNNKYSLRMPKTDTRYFVQEIVKKMDSDYWDDYYKNFQNQEFANMLYSYFLKTSDDDFVKFNGRPKIPMTDLKEELIEFSLPTHEKFYKDVMDGEYKLSKKILKPEFVYTGKTYKYATTLQDLWIEYLNWGSEMGEKDLKKKYLEFKQQHNGKFRFIDLGEKIINIQTLHFKE